MAWARAYLGRFPSPDWIGMGAQPAGQRGVADAFFHYTMDVERYKWLIEAALKEDVGPGDATTEALIPPESQSVASMRSRQEGVACGLELARAVFCALSPDVAVQRVAKDGQKVLPGDVLLKVTGPTRALLTGERTALNFVQRLSGVATLTHRFASQLTGTGARLLDTRKTTPGWRELEKYAVLCGGGTNHRHGLYDLILIKDNHLAAVAAENNDPVVEAVRRAREKFPELKVEVEADTLQQVEDAVRAGADIILLDNMTPEQLRRAVEVVSGRARTEASGGVNLETVRSIAETGVDYISAGSLTHSAAALDIGLDFD